MAKAEDGFQFFGRVWRADIELQSCSLAARGLWAQLLTVMDEASPRGYLLIKGTIPNVERIARLGGCSAGEARKLLAELAQQGVSRVTAEGVIFSHRMVADSEKSARARRAVEKRWGGSDDGKGGGGGLFGKAVGIGFGNTELDTEGDTEGDTKAGTERHTKSPSPLHPPSPSESLLESSSSSSSVSENRIRARGKARGGLQENQAVGALVANGFSVEKTGENGLRIGAVETPKADQVLAYRRVRELLVTRYGKDDFGAYRLLEAAYDKEAPEHVEAKAFVERVSRENGCGLYCDRPLLPKARHGGRA